MTHAYLLVIRYADGRERSTRHRTVDSARARVDRQTAAGQLIDAALVLSGPERRHTAARYTRAEGWKGDPAA